MQIILANGAVLNPIAITGAPKFVQGAERDALTFHFTDASLDEMDAIFTEGNCESIKIIDKIINDDGTETPTEDIHNGYTIRAELNKKLVEVQASTPDNDAVSEIRVTVTMAQRTYAESKLAALSAKSTDTQIAVAELAEIIMGGM